MKRFILLLALATLTSSIILTSFAVIPGEDAVSINDSISYGEI